jgi:photosystem II stability/assembly factor-like uncharacterized protein
MFRKQIQIIPPVSFRLALPFVVVAHLLCTPALLAQNYEWKVIARPNLNPLLSVDFIDTLHGVCGVFGEPGALVTTDGGLSWDTARTVFAPRAMDLINASDGWASGTSGNGISDIARTTDGGRSWQTIREVIGEEFHGVAGLSPTKCICAGFAWQQFSSDTALIVRTTDGGLTWQRTLFDIGVWLYYLEFPDSLHGFAADITDSVLMKTTDGGNLWKRYGLPPWGEALTFLTGLDGWFRASPHVYRTRDGGEHWTRIYSDPPSNDDSFRAERLCFTDSLYGWAFGGNVYMGYISEAIYHTTDGGYSWQKESEGLTDDLGVNNDAVMLDHIHGWAVAADGRVLAYKPKSSDVEPLPTGELLPSGIRLAQNYPNPFNPSTTIRYELPHAGHVTLKVYNTLGQEVATLVNETKPAGSYTVQFDAGGLASGVYFYRLQAGDFVQAKKLVVLR